MLKRQVISCLGWLIAAVFLGLYRENRVLIKSFKSNQPDHCEQKTTSQEWSKILICFEELVKEHDQNDESLSRIHTRYGGGYIFS